MLLLMVAVAATANGVADVALSGVAPVLRRTGSFAKVSRTVVPVAATIPLYTPIIAVLAYAYVFISPWTVALFLTPGYRRSAALHHVSRAARDSRTIVYCKRAA